MLHDWPLEPASPRWPWLVGAGGVLFVLVWTFGWPFGQSSRPEAAERATQVPLSPADARQQELLKANAGQPGDPDLTRQFSEINAKHFGGALAPVAVRWEPGLAQVGPLVGDGIVLQGMFGKAGAKPMILLNPVVGSDPRARDRALCHEIVHAYLSSMGDDTTAHGPAFQAILERLAAEGAFEGIAADPREKARLKAWLDSESVRIDQERRQIDAMDADIKRDGAGIDAEIAEFNARADRPAAEAQALEARRLAFNQRVLEANERVERDRADLARFNAEVARYNLMMSYPDGLDEQSLVRSKPAARGGGRR